MNKTELESKHLAELHALAAAANVPRYRMLPRAELIEKLSGGDGGSSRQKPAQAKEQPSRPRRERGGRERRPRERGEPSGRAERPAREDRPPREDRPTREKAPEPEPGAAEAPAKAEAPAAPKRKRRRRR